MNALDALDRARRAWEATQPQLFFDVLDEPAPSRALGRLSPGGLVEHTEVLTAGAEPSRGERPDGGRVAGPHTGTGWGRRHFTTTGGGAPLDKVARHPQRGA